MAFKDDQQALYQLQKLDLETARLAQELAGLDTGGKAAARVKHLRQAAEQAAVALHQAEGELKDRELALESTEIERKAKWGRAYGGAVSDSKELTALERKIEELDRRRSQLEEENLACYDRVAELRRHAAATQAAAQAGVRRAKQMRAQYLQRTESLQQRQQEVAAQREARVLTLSADLYRQYEQQRSDHAGVAIAAVAGGSCSNCHMRIPSIYVQQLRKPTRMLACEGCGCWLVIEE